METICITLIALWFIFSVVAVISSSMLSSQISQGVDDVEE